MSNETFVVGRQPVLEALENEKRIDKVIISRTAKGDIIQQIKNLCKEKDIYFQSVPEEKLRRDFKSLNHQGVAALISIINYYELQDLINYVLDSGELPFFIVLDGVTDVRNLGAISRTAYGLGVHGIIIPQKKSAPIRMDAIKSSAGALLHIPVCRVNNLSVAVKDLKLNGIEVIGIHTSTDFHISDIQGDIPIAIVMGAEDTGISKSLQKEISRFYKIPIQHIDSYNVSVATALTLYQISMNRNFSYGN